MVIFEAVRVLTMFALAFAVAIFLTPTTEYLLAKFGMRKKNIRGKGEAPVFHELHKGKSNTITMGGIIVWGTVLALALIFFLLSRLFGGFAEYFNFVDRAQTYLPLVALLLAALVGLADDIHGVLKSGEGRAGFSVTERLALYTVVAALGAIWFYFRLGWDVLYVPFIGTVALGPAYMLVFVFVLVATAFSTNETDGLDGLAAGVLLFAYGALTIVSFVLGRYELAVMTGAILGALLAFLWFNIYPARFFMGDTGAMSLGITLGTVAMLTNTALFLPFFASILVIESLSVLVQVASKKIRGKKIFRSAPIHHHFEAIGWHESQITMRFWIIAAVTSTFGLVLFFLARFA